MQFVHAQRSYLQAFASLTAIAGAEALPASPLVGDVEAPPTVDAEQQVARLTTQNPTLERAQQRVAVAQAQLKSAQREPVPNLTVKAGEWYSGEQLGSTNIPAGPMSFVEAGVNLPLWNRNQGNIEAAKVDLERAQEDVTRTRLILRWQAEEFTQDYQSACFEAERYRDELLPRARRAYQLYLMKYQQMASAYPQVLLSQQALFQLQMQYLAALGLEWSDTLSLENRMLEGGVAQSESDAPGSPTMNLPDGGVQ